MRRNDRAVVQGAQLYREGEHRIAAMPELEMLRGRSVGIIGCTGLIGAAALTTLLAANAAMPQERPIRIYGVARNPGAHLPQDTPDFQFVRASVTDPDLEDKLPACDYLLYVAGTTSDYLNRRNETIQTQVVGLERFLMRAVECRRFVYISSTRVYGRDGGETPITEDRRAVITPMHTDNLYDSCKHLGESLCLWHALKREIPTSVARLTNIYGPPQALRSETALTDFVRQAGTKHEIILTGHPDSIRNQCCVLDIVQGVLKTLTRGQTGRAYNIGSHEHITSREMAQYVAAAFTAPVAIRLPQSGVQPSLQYVSIDRAARELEYVPTFRFAQLAPLVVQQTLEALEIE